MTTNKPGTVTQQPLYGCTSCYEECTYPADHLRVYDNECWCDECWDERRDEFPDQPSWSDLEPYTPALQAELKKAVAALTDGRFTRCDGPAGWRPPLGKPAGTLIDRIDSLEDECDQLRKDAERCRFLRDAESLPMNLMRLEMIGDVMDSAVDAAMRDREK